MRIAFIADIHANYPALKSVLNHLETQKVDMLFCLGDVVGYGPYPNECIEILKKLHIPTIMGNYDDGIGNFRFVCGCDYKDEAAQQVGEASIRWTKENTTEENKNFLRLLPNKLTFEIQSHKFLLVHGSPTRLNEYLDENVSDEYIDDLLEEGGCNILVCGHTHIPFFKETSKGILINAGSVGKPKHGSPNSTYVLVDVTEQEIEVEIQHVPYDVQETIDALSRTSLPVVLRDKLISGKG